MGNYPILLEKKFSLHKHSHVKQVQMPCGNWLEVKSVNTYRYTHMHARTHAHMHTQTESQEDKVLYCFISLNMQPV